MFGDLTLHAEALRDKGFAVFDIPGAGVFREELLSLVASGSLSQHRFQFGNELYEKPGIFEADLHSEHVRAMVPHFNELFFSDSLVQELDRHLPDLGLLTGVAAKTVKLQHNSGGGACFPAHYDNAGRPSKRAVTCLVYLNMWKPGDGGELVLWPFLGPPVRVPPVLGRVALFLSDRVLHRVEPANTERLCFTIWLDGANVNSDRDCNLTMSRLPANEEMWTAFQCSPLQRSLSRAVYAEEYERSLLECMGGEAGVMLEAHKAQVEQLRNHAALCSVIDECRERRRLAVCDED